MVDNNTPKQYIDHIKNSKHDHLFTPNGYDKYSDSSKVTVRETPYSTRVTRSITMSETAEKVHPSSYKHISETKKRSIDQLQKQTMLDEQNWKSKRRLQFDDSIQSNTDSSFLDISIASLPTLDSIHIHFDEKELNKLDQSTWTPSTDSCLEDENKNTHSQRNIEKNDIISTPNNIKSEPKRFNRCVIL
ncbi:hypothetical protein WA158_007405 [Blastocystis sp. Blastoise]